MAPEEVVAKVFGLAPIEVSDATSNTTVGTWDSLAHMTLIVELEVTYGVSLSPENALSMTDVGSVKRILSTHGVSW